LFRKLLASLAALTLASAAVLFIVRAANADAANISITATQATTGTTTLTYRATVLKAGTIREITMAIPAGTTGRVTSANGTVSSVTSRSCTTRIDDGNGHLRASHGSVDRRRLVSVGPLARSRQDDLAWDTYLRA